MRGVLATLSATLLIATLLAGCDRRSDTAAGGGTAATGASPAMPAGSAASR